MSKEPADTATKILDVAERLVQARGFNGFSYADVADELGISKAALHYHFPGKAELGEALMERYAARFARALIDVDAREPRGLLEAAALLFDHRVVGVAKRNEDGLHGWTK